MNTEASGFLHQPTAQIHLTRLCNLQCQHCYSESGPGQRSQLPLTDLFKLYGILCDEGYTQVSFSGGEPLVYPYIEEAIDVAIDHGLKVNLITNGLLLKEDRMRRWQGKVDLVGVSIDGMRTRHDRMRGRKGVFDKVIAKLELIRQSGIPFGLAHCVTPDSLGELPDILTLAINSGASLLQLHPLNQVGSALGLLEPLSGDDLSRLYIIAKLMQLDCPSDFRIQLDLVPASEELRYSWPVSENNNSLSSIANPLVVREDGSMVPLNYSAGRSVQIAGCSKLWMSDIKHWKASGQVEFQATIAQTMHDVNCAGAPFIDWYDYFARASKGLGVERDLIPALGLD